MLSTGLTLVYFYYTFLAIEKKNNLTVLINQQVLKICPQFQRQSAVYTSMLSCIYA